MSFWRSLFIFPTLVRNETGELLGRSSPENRQFTKMIGRLIRVLPRPPLSPRNRVVKLESGFSSSCPKYLPLRRYYERRQTGDSRPVKRKKKSPVSPCYWWKLFSSSLLIGRRRLLLSRRRFVVVFLKSIGSGDWRDSMRLFSHWLD